VEPSPAVTYPWRPSGVKAMPVAPGNSIGAPIWRSIEVSIWIRLSSVALAA